ncbi:MAG: exopolyphosphatase [Actinobacteria bacterium BACL4 MAG-121022-bin9]|uniref:Ppx/GppA phosphatase family protein n=1 Tax=Candidatus Nanopelagicus sp. TaxID=2518620 RepID=UPI000714541C|nr:MAG: exopolyphosphatase [Actinobacteria bacterium BACL4 MAG-121022-bin9]KRO77178.1 MAG: exopolyphosphatase [Actinobacteria bacterium BACL4 MAG-120920-bin74]
MSRVAAIDCGTNSIRLLIADISGGKFKEVLRDMEIVRLGQGVDENKSFHPDAINRTLAAVEKFKNQLAGKGVEKIRFCATSATRDAANRDLFIDGVRQILGVEVEVIPGEEEARLSFNGATKELLQSDAPFLVVDIGGGSTEFVYGNKEVEFAKSVDIGCVRMSERHLKSQPVEMSQVAQAIIDIDKAIAQAAAVVPISTAKTLVAVAGTATTIAAAALELETYDRYAIHLSRIPAEKVHKVSAAFQAMTKSEISNLGFMHPGRVDVITAGSLVLSRVMAATGATEFVASESDILDGMAWSLIN